MLTLKCPDISKQTMKKRWNSGYCYTFHISRFSMQCPLLGTSISLYRIFWFLSELNSWNFPYEYLLFAVTLPLFFNEIEYTSHFYVNNFLLNKARIIYSKTGHLIRSAPLQDEQFLIIMSWWVMCIKIYVFRVGRTDHYFWYQT